MSGVFVGNKPKMPPGKKLPNYTDTKKADRNPPFYISRWLLSINHHASCFASGFVAQNVDSALELVVQHAGVAVADFNSATVNAHHWEYVEQTAIGQLVGNAGLRLGNFLSAEYQDGMNENYINTYPVRKDSFEKLVSRAKNKETMQYYTVTTADGYSVDMQPLDDATAKKIRDAIDAADRLAVNDTRISEIIDEALEAVYNGSKTSADAAADIQNKVSTYLNEIK